MIQTNTESICLLHGTAQWPYSQSIVGKVRSPNLRIFTGRSTHEGFSRKQVFEWMARDIRAVTWQIKENVWVDGLQVPTDLERLDGQEQVLEARRAMAQAILWFAIAPAIAPILGGWLHEMFGWRSVFWYRLQRKHL